MPVNLPGPYELEFDLTGWTSPNRTHKIRFNVIAVGNPAVGTLPTAITMQKLGGGTGTLASTANQIWEYLRLFWATSISASGYTLWKYVPGTYAKDFITAGTLTNPAASASGGTPGHQLTMTFRSGNGGIAKVVLLETNQSGNTRVTLSPNPAGTPPQRLAAYLLSVDSIVIGRDDAFLVSALRDARGENEALFRLLFRG